MAYATDAQIRKICSIDTNQISDLTEFISMADLWLKSKIMKYHDHVEISGVIDASNKEFQVPVYPIADSDLDGDVDKDDVTVYYATLSTLNNFRLYGSAQTVTSVTSNDGLVYVTTAPTITTAIDGVYASYYSWNVFDVNYNLFKLISSYAAAGLAQRKAVGLAVNFDAIPVSIREQVGGDCLETAKGMLNGILMSASDFNSYP